MTVPGTGAAAWHAARMLRWLGASVDCRAEHTGSAADWALSGAMALTGRRTGPPLLPPGQAASAVRGALLATELVADAVGRLPGVQVLGERAAAAGLLRDAPRSAAGAFQLARAADGWLGVNLARPSDVELIPAWLGGGNGEPDSAWQAVVARRSAGELAARARLLGLPAAAVPDGPDEQLVARGQAGQVRPLVVSGLPRPGGGRPAGALVVDLSSLWAGPLCGHLLTLLGARVVKVESTHRPDGGRLGPRAFYDLLHAGQESVTVDFTTPTGRRELAGLVAAADVVIEASRPRALRQVGVDADEVLDRAEHKVWVSITAYGRTGPWSNAVGFGDDAAVAAGLLATDPVTGTPAPCGDAIADPVTGVNAALAAVACLTAGGTWLVDLAMREQVAATLVDTSGPADVPDVADPVMRRPAGVAPASGADTARVLAELGLA
ncbi:MAG TPA: CoA transferase [Mycobacteriales bacterium]|nr:CoA transferase [Mycobacteriales bacterium]